MKINIGVFNLGTLIGHSFAAIAFGLMTSSPVIAQSDEMSCALVLNGPNAVDDWFARSSTNANAVSEIIAPIEQAFAAGDLLEVINEVGNIAITRGESGQGVRIEAKKSARTWSPSADVDLEAIIDNISIVVEPTDQGARVRVVTPRPLPVYVNTTVDLFLTLPELADIDVEHDVGAVQIERIVGSKDINLDVGNLASILVAAPAKDQQHTLSVDVGDIVQCLPGAANFDLAAMTELGSIEIVGFDIDVASVGWFGQSALGQAGDGGALFSLTVDVGNIMLEAQ